MRAVWRKALADLAGRPFQSGLIALTIAAAAALLYLGLVTLNLASAPYERQMVRANSAHAWLYLSSSDDSLTLAARIAALPEVTAVTAVRERWATRLILPDGATPIINLTAMPPGQPAMDRYLVAAGRELAPGDTDNVVLDASYARHHGIELGDQVAIATPDGPRSLHVVGLHAEPRICHYPSCGGVVMLMLPETYADIVGDRTHGYSVGVQLADPHTAAAFISQARRLETDTARVLDGLSWQRIRAIHQMAQTMSFALILSVAVAAVAAAGLISANIISGAVLAQYREIGLLKSLGLTPRQVFGLFAGQNGLLALLGAVAGTAAGHLLVQARLADVAFNMADNALLRFQPGTAGLVLAVMLTIATLFSLLAAWQAIKAPPHAALTQGFAAPRARVPLSVRLATALGLPIAAILGIKDAAARPGRMLLTILSLSFCLITVALSVGLHTLVDRLATDRSFLGINYDLDVMPGLLEPDAAVDAVHNLQSVDTYYTTAYTTANLPEHDAVLYLRGLGGHPEAFSFPILAGRMAAGADELVLAAPIMERLDLRVGDALEVRLGNRSRRLTIVGVYRSFSEMGQTALVLLPTLQELLPDAAGQHIFIRLQPGADPEAARRDLLAQTQYRIAANLPGLELPHFIADGLQVVKLLALLMAAIAMLSLINSALITAREQMKEVGIRKAVGITPRQILAAVASGGLFLGLLGSLLGIPIGLLVNQALVAQLARAFGVGPIAAGPSGAVFALLMALGLGLAMVAALPVALWAGRLRTARVLAVE